jgi:hypothetical protein
VARRSCETAVALALALVLNLVPLPGWDVRAAAEDEADSGIDSAEPVPATVKPRKLNIRSGPGIQYGILRAAKAGEKLPILEIDNGWAKIDMDPPGWVLVRYLRVPERFGLDPFVMREDAFIDWAVATEYLEEIALQDQGVIWVVLTSEGYARTERPVEIARRLACGYREHTGFEDRIEVIVWPAEGPGDTRVTAQTCDE